MKTLVHLKSPKVDLLENCSKKAILESIYSIIIRSIPMQYNASFMAVGMSFFS